MERSIESRLPDRALADDLTDSFDRLRALLAGAGSHVLPEDLQGSSGVLFRTFWYLGREDDSHRRWSSRSASVVPEDSLARAAEAYGFLLARDGAALERFADPPTIESRARAIKRSIRFGIDLFDRKVLRRSGLFASGAAAYEALRGDLAGPPERFFPSSRDEAEHLTPEIALFGERDPETTLRLSLSLALGRSLRLFGTARRRLCIYLDRAGNFVESTAGLDHFEKESSLLLRAAALVLEPLAAPRGSVRDAAPATDPIASDRARRDLRRLIRIAAREHRKGMESLRRTFLG